ncbi:MAG: hypothetical protein QXZ28_02865 [Candidatus Methanomethylicaceae archaeon]
MPVTLKSFINKHRALLTQLGKDILQGFEGLSTNDKPPCAHCTPIVVAICSLDEEFECERFRAWTQKLKGDNKRLKRARKANV